MKRAQLALLAILLGGHFACGNTASAQRASAPPESLDCNELDCAAVLPGTARFEQVEGRAFAVGLAEDGSTVGWVVLSTTVVDIPAYSGKPLVTLVGLSPDGIISGARVIHHSEPILLVGIPESTLHHFVEFYAGKEATARIVVGSAHDSDAIAVDVISGATVTALAQNKTILESARILGLAVGVVDATHVFPGHFIEEEVPWTWQKMVEEGVFGRLTVTQAEMGEGESEEAFVDLWFTIADAPQIGRALLGDGDYEHQLTLLEPGEHLFIVLGLGSSSFKGSGFVRGGIFDRIRVEQGLAQILFRDTDYENLSRVRAEDAPRFKEGAIFITRDAPLDPGASFALVFLGSRYDGRGGFSREFREFKTDHQLPDSVYVSERPFFDAIWAQAWRNHFYNVIALSLFLLFVAGVFIGRRITTADAGKLRILHLGTMAISLGMVGFYMSAQPSVTQVLTLVDSIVSGWRFDLFASEPLIFLMWIFIFISSLIWGRGVFCGWLCPYGALTELLFELAKKLGVKHYELPEQWHRRLRYLRYFLLAGLVPVYLYDSILAERLAEIEPFKTTFFVPFWTRHWALISWWALLLFASLFWYRPFCRYLCPLGAGLSIFNSFRFSGPRRRAFCSSCTICAKGCEPLAIRKDGTIDPRECLSCMQCEATYRDVTRCPPLVGIERLTSRGDLTSSQVTKLSRLRGDARTE